MKKTFLVLTLLTILFAACGNEDTVYSLNENEIFFNEQLSSLTMDGNECYVGTEDGRIYRYNVDMNIIDTIYSDYDFDRIYRVVKDKKNNHFWVGARNMGIYLCAFENDTLIVREEYAIKVNGKEYSPYDIECEKSGIYVGTSNGLYKIPQDISYDSLTLLYPDDNHKSWYHSRPFVINCIEKYDERYLVASSDDGLMRIDMHNDEVVVIGKNERVKNVVVREEGIYALVDSGLKVYDIDGSLKHEYPFELYADFYYYVPETGVNYFISHDHMYLVQDKDIASPDEYKRVELRRGTRPECRNIIVNAKSINRSLLVTKNALFGIGHNLDIFNGAGEAHSVSVDRDDIYFLVGRRLFKTNSGNTSDGVHATHIFNIPLEYEVKYMSVIDGYLHFIDIERNVYVIGNRLSDNFYLNTLASLFSIECIQTLDKDVTAFGGGGYLCGIRDSILSFDKDMAGREVMLYKDDTRKRTTDSPYVTSFTNRDGRIWATTLNDGIYVGDGHEMELVEGSMKYRNIRDISFVRDMEDPYLLTPHYIYTPTGDSIRAKGYYRMLVADDGPIYCIGEFGIRRFFPTADGYGHEDYFTDVKFNPASVAFLDGKLYAGSTCGVFVLDALSADSLIYEPMLLEQVVAEDFIDYMLYLFAILMLCILAAVATRVYEKKRYSIERLQSDKSEILERLCYLESLAPYISGVLIERIKSNIRQVESLEISNSYKSQRMIKALKKRVDSTREQVEVGVRELLESQKKMLKKAGKGYAETLLAESARSFSFAGTAVQIRKNSEWLEYSSNVAKELDDIQELFRPLAVIDGVTQGIMADVRRVRQHMAGNSEKEVMDELRRRVKEIASDGNCMNVISFLDAEITKHKESPLVAGEFERLKSKVGEVKGNRELMIELLRDIRIACERVTMRESVARVGEMIDEFYAVAEEKRNIETRIDEIPEYELSLIKELSVRRDELKNRPNDIVKMLQKEFEKFYHPVIEKNLDLELFSYLGLTLSNCRNYSNNAKILLLLLSGRKVENNHIHILIGIPHREENMRKERWMVEQNLRKNAEKVAAYAKMYPLSCAEYAAQCIILEK